MTHILNMTPIEIGTKLLHDKNTHEVYIVDEPYTNNIQKKVVFKVLDINQEDGWEQGYCIDFMIE